MWNHNSLKFNLVVFDGGYRLVLESSLTKVWATEDEPSKPLLNPKSGWLKPNFDPFVVTTGTLLSARPLRYELEPTEEGEVGFLGTFGMGWSMVSSLPLASDSNTSMWNQGRPTTTTDAFYMDPYLSYEISVIDVPQIHHSFVPFVLCRSSVFNDTRSCVGQGRRAGRRTKRKRQTMTLTLSIFFLSNWRLQAQAIMWEKRWCGACGPLWPPGPKLLDLTLNMVSPCPLQPRYYTAYHSRSIIGIIH